MFKKNYGQSARSGKSGFRRSNGGGGNRGGGQRGGKRSFGQTIDPSRFVCKAAPISRSEPYKPEHQFADFNLDGHLKRNISEKGYVNPTPIQDKAIQAVLDQSDVVGIANTGTGKTAAFLIPLLNKVIANSREKVLIIVPTRELAVQINEEFIEFRRSLPIYSVCCFGGASINQQITGLRRSHNFVIGTPGRLKDLVSRGIIKLGGFSTIVLDEADRMLDMGFVNDMRFIVSGMAQNRQTLLFSATMTSEIDKLIKEFLKNPVTISVKTGDTAKNVDQDVVYVRENDSKVEVLYNLLTKPEFSKVLIFGRTKHGVEKLSVTLNQSGFKAGSIHGNKNQANRQRTLELFKKNQCQVLVATDVAARGLDIPNVSHVINYDVPDTYEDYVHRIGRTGRADKTGKALTFVSHGGPEQRNRTRR